MVFYHHVYSFSFPSLPPPSPRLNVIRALVSKFVLKRFNSNARNFYSLLCCTREFTCYFRSIRKIYEYIYIHTYVDLSSIFSVVMVCRVYRKIDWKNLVFLPWNRCSHFCPCRMYGKRDRKILPRCQMGRTFYTCRQILPALVYRSDNLATTQRTRHF